MSALAASALLALAMAVRIQEPPQPPAPEPVPAPETPPVEEGGGDEDEGGGGQEPPVAEEGGQETPPPENPPPVEVAPAPAPPAQNEPPAAPPRPPVVWPLDAAGVAAHLAEICARYPELARQRSIGRSAQGRELLVLTLGSATDPRALDRPALVLADYQGPAAAGAELGVELAWRVCERFASDEGLRALLSDSALLIAPALDPDRRAGGEAAAKAVAFERNFPLGWQPHALRPGSGRIPLSEPETLAAVRFLSEQHNAAVLLGIAAPEPATGPFQGAELPDEDRVVFQRLCAALELSGQPPVSPWFELGSPGGGFFDFAYQARGIYPLALPPPGEELLAGEGLAAWLDATSARALTCLAQLPRVRASQVGLERLDNEQWQLDVRLENAGLVPTRSALGRRRGQGGEIELLLRGAKLVATASRTAGGASYLEASFHEAQESGALGCGTLLGGEDRFLRLVLAAAAGSRVELTGGASWAGTTRLEVVLP